MSDVYYSDSIYKPDKSPITNVRNKFGLNRGSSLRLSSGTLRRYQDAFDKFDTQRTGAIGREELRKLLEKLGHRPTDDEIKEMLSVDPSAKGEHITFHGFCRLMSTQMSEDEKVSELKEVFDAFDSDRDGYIAISEFKQTLEDVFGEPVDDLEDLLGDSVVALRRIDFNQFQALMSSQAKLPV
eukprot:TRINITY_DN8844_c0_g1_i1.p1 TRINITY_DN8844_c0_g1~~TRINITY_DN8844_c0_g1_i1.p1  ORF type:complete len:183 (+),score=17.61 TRINITY_DN8844_c0_g1_i1:24-572(+)